MKIAYLTCVYPPYPGGIGVVAEGLAREMSKRGHEVHVFAPNQESGIRNQESGVRVHYLVSWLRFGNAALLPQMLWRLRGFDVAHVLYPFYGVAEFVPLLRRFLKAKIVVHHLMDAVDTGWRGKFFQAHTQYLMPLIFRAAHLILAISEDYFRNSSLVRAYESFDQAPAIEFIPNGVDTELFQPKGGTNSESPANLQIRKFVENSVFVPIILFVGGLDRAHYFKGVDVLIEALRILKWGGVAFNGQIIGEGELRPNFEAHARAAGLLHDEQGEGMPARVTLAQGSVEFLGLVPHEKLPQYYQQATVCVVPSTESIECFSITAAEAQACGIPTIVSDFPGVRTTIEEGVTGLLTRPGDPEELAHQIFKLIEDTALAQKMGQAGRTRAEKFFSWTTIGDKLSTVYEDLSNH